MARSGRNDLTSTSYITLFDATQDTDPQAVFPHDAVFVTGTTGGSYTAATRTVTYTGAFTNLPTECYGRRINIRVWTNGTAGWYTIQSKTSADAIVLVADPRLPTGNTTSDMTTYDSPPAGELFLLAESGNAQGIYVRVRPNFFSSDFLLPSGTPFPVYAYSRNVGGRITKLEAKLDAADSGTNNLRWCISGQ